MMVPKIRGQSPQCERVNRILSEHTQTHVDIVLTHIHSLEAYHNHNHNNYMCNYYTNPKYNPTLKTKT